MNRVKSRLMRRHVAYMGAVAAMLCGLALLLYSCEKDVEDPQTASGKKIVVNFSLDEGGYVATEVVPHNFNAKNPETETVVVRLDDDVSVHATLEVEPANRMRAATLPLKDGAKLRIVAYDGSKYVNSADYTITGGKPVADSSPLEVDSGSYYTFVAYSFYAASQLPGHSETLSGIEPAKDLLWGKSAATIDANNRRVRITMKHKFSKVTVCISATTINKTISAVSGVSVTPGYKADLTVYNGTITQGSAVSQAVPEPLQGINSLAVTGDPVIVYTAGSSMTDVKIQSITVGGNTYSDVVSGFNMQMEEGKAYTLTVNFKQSSRWALTNVYWDGQKLTFGESGSLANKYQGVFFKWGSLVGISPARANGSVVFSANVPLYFPDPQTRTWRIAYANSWSNIKPETTRPLLGSEEYLLNNPDFNNFKGDICDYIGQTGAGPKNYRLPTTDYFKHIQVANLSSIAWQDITRTNTEKDNYPDGKYNNIPAYAICDVAIYPASGMRIEDGSLFQVSEVGYYWTSKIVGRLNLLSNYACTAQFGQGGISTGNDVHMCPREYALPVRCIKK
ncbi:MAG: fimbrillin family protein [Dysgonamonadaceae bacterium]|jgi:hypothetical protein|nr:fimbrillin family protein [Dysgonamonadaceae bacterium]